MLEANEGLEKIFEDAVKEAEKRKHEYVTIEHVLLSLVKDTVIGTTLTEFKINTKVLIKEIEDYLDGEESDQAMVSGPSERWVEYIPATGIEENE